MTKTGWGVLALALLFVPPAFAQTAADEMAQRRTEQALPRTAIAFDPTQFDKFVGYYHMPANLRPNTVITLSSDDEHFFIQLSRQPAREILPESADKFFLNGIPAQVSFTLDAQGRVSGLVVHQGGLEIPAPRIDAATAKSIEAAPLPQPKGHPAPRTWQTMAGIVPRLLTNPAGTGMDYWPCFSPDGKTILFSRTLDGGKSWSLMRVGVTGGEPATFATAPLPVSATRADWSAKTDLIAFTGTASDGGNSVWILNGDGSGAHAVTAGSGSSQIFYPSWYPDGKALAVMDGSASVIRRLDAAGGAATALTDPTKVLTGMASVSPDGKTIVFAGQKNSGQPYNQNENVLWLVDEHGGLGTVENPPLQGRAPVWSPDGRRIAFESDRASPDGRYAIFIVNRDGNGLVQVTDYALGATHPVWSADGRHMVFAQGQPGDKAGMGIAVIDLP